MMLNFDLDVLLQFFCDEEHSWGFLKLHFLTVPSQEWPLTCVKLQQNIQGLLALPGEERLCFIQADWPFLMGILITQF